MIVQCDILFVLVDASTPSSSRSRPSSLLTHTSTSHGQFYGTNSSLKSSATNYTFNQNLARMSMMQQESYLQQQQQQQQHLPMPYGTFANDENARATANTTPSMYDR
jgi:hypothetical protein